MLFRSVVSTYQSVSGGGKDPMDELIDQTKEYLEGKKIVPKNFTKQIAFNIIPHIDMFADDGYTKEELKMTNETKKILDEKIRKLNLERLKLIDSKSSKVVLNNLLLHDIGGIDLENFLMVRNLTNFEFQDILRSIDVVAELYKHHKWLILRKNWVYLQKLILDELYKNKDHNFNNGTDLISLSNALKVKVPDFVIQNIINESVKTQKMKKYKNLY